MFVAFDDGSMGPRRNPADDVSVFTSFFDMVAECMLDPMFLTFSTKIAANEKSVMATTTSKRDKFSIPPQFCQCNW